MPKTEVILTHNIVGLGGESDQVKVAAGYARNYLYPQGLAIPVTASNKRRLESLRQKRAEREAHDLNSMTELSKSLGKLLLVIAVKTGEDGKMFGSVTAGNIIDELKRQHEVALEKKKVQLPHGLRALGEHEVELRLHPDVTTTLKLRIESSTAVKPQAPEAHPPASGRSPAAGKASPAGKAATPARETEKARAPQRETGPAKGEREAAPPKDERSERKGRPQKPSRKE